MGFVYGYSRKSIDLTDDARKTIFNLLITVLPIAISFFSLSIDKPWLKINIFPLILCFTISYLIAVYSLIKFGIDRPTNTIKANKSIFYSLIFLVLGLINMLLLIDTSFSVVVLISAMLVFFILNRRKSSNQQGETKEGR